MEILKGIGTFLQDQVLGMKWLNEVIGNMLSLFGLDAVSYTHLRPTRPY